MIQSENEIEETIDLKEELLKYVQHWRWFIVVPILTLIIAYFYLQYAQRAYKVETTIIVKDEKGGGLSDQLAAFSDMGFMGAKNNIENEVEILKSRTLTEKAIDSLHLNITYLSNESIRKDELYLESPFLITIHSFVTTSDSGVKYPLGFTLTENSNKIHVETDKKELGTFSFNAPIQYQGLTFSVAKNPNFSVNAKNSKKSNSVDAFVNTIRNTSEAMNKSLTVDPTSKTSSVLKLSYVTNNAQKGVDYLNHLVDLYNEQAILDKQLIAQNTSDFISNRLNIIATELGDVEKDVEKYKNTNKISDIETEIRLSLENMNDFQKSVVENEVQIKVVNDMLSHLRNSKANDLLPSNYLKDNAQVSAIEEVNKLIIERNKLMQNDATLENPNVVLLDKQISSIKSTILSSLRQQATSLSIIKNDLKKQEGEINSRISMVPRQEREFRIIDRQQKVKEALYLFLLQKREETNISIAATELNAKIIDKAIDNDKPIAPKKLIILLAALLIGLIIPFVIIYINQLLDTKIKTRLDLEGKTPIPFLGDVPTSDSHDELMEINSRSSSAEAIRIIRTNIEFLLPEKENEAKVIFSTSSFPGEGKTFISANLAATIALSGKKVLLIGMDLRNPKLKEYVDMPVIGVTNYVANDEHPIDYYIVKIDGYENFYGLPAGNIPPNPAELLMSKKTSDMMAYLKTQFDYIVVDTAPVSLVTDTLLIAKYADAFIYVIRANKLDKKMLNIPLNLYKENKLPNMSLLLNDTDYSKGYGYGYGYGQLNENVVRPLWKKILGIK